MKNKMLPFILSAVLLGFTASAQTNTTGSVSNLLGGVPGGLQQIVNDGQAALSGLNFAQGVKLTPFGIKHQGDYGFGFAVTTALTNSIVQAGFGVVAIQETTTSVVNGKTVTSKAFDFYDATLNLSLTKSETFLGIQVDFTAESGPAYDLKGGALLEQSAVFASHTFTLDSGNLELTLGGGLMHCSKWAGDVEDIGFLQFTTHLRGSGWLGIW